MNGPAYLRNLEILAAAIAATGVVGIAAVMFLARGTGEDITGVVAPTALLVVLASAAALLVGARRRRAEAQRRRP